MTLAPPVPGAAVTREGDQICVSGLPSGATTRILLRAGLPGEDGLSLVKQVALNVAIANRRPRIDFDTRMFVLPRGQTPTISMSTVNLSAVKLTLARLTERNIVAFVRENRLGQPVETYSANNIGEQTGRVVWQGGAAIPTWQPNHAARTALPLPDALTTSGPGLYALSAEAGDGTPNATGAVQMILRTDLGPHGVARRRRADHPGARLLRCDAAGRCPAAADRSEQRHPRPRRPPTPMAWPGSRAPLLHGEGPVAPRAIHAFGSDDDFTMLDLDGAAFDLVRSRRGRHAGPGTARRLRLARSRHLPAGRDRAGHGAAARRRRQAGRHARPYHHPPAQRPGVPADDAAARP